VISHATVSARIKLPDISHRSHTTALALNSYNGSVNLPVSVTAIDDASSQPAVRGFLHRPNNGNGDGLVLTHGAGGNCQSKLLIAVANAFAVAGVAVLRCDLPFRQHRASGPPFPGTAAADRAGLCRAAEVLKESAVGRIYIGGHSYGGRQATMLAAEDPAVAAGLLLLSYPLHPPRKPTELRTAHFSQLHTPALFAHGTRDPFASTEELASAMKLIPARTALFDVEGAGHDLMRAKGAADVPERIVRAFLEFLG
jgi:uncharacterized protein